jgi:hypothetical protein
MQTVQERFGDLYAAFNARDIDAVLAAMDPDVDWPNGMEGGRVRGHAAVRAYWTRQWEAVDPRVEPVRVADDGAGRVVVDVHQVVRDRAGALLADQLVRHVYELRAGRVVRMEIRPADG